MKLKLFYCLMITALVVGFASCGDDDKETTPWNKDDLKGNYSGTGKIYLTENIMASEDTVKQTITVAFGASQDANALAVNIPNLVGDDKATAFGFGSNVYTFRLSDIPALTFTSSQIPSFLSAWFGKFFTYTAIDKVVLNLKCVDGGKYNKSTNKMDFKYTGTATYTYKDPSNATKTQILKIEYSYPEFKK